MKTQEEIQQLSEKDFNNRQSVGHYELADLKSRDYYCDGFSNGYNQCQEDMKTLIQDLWQLWKDLAQAGDLQIGMHFNKRFDELENEIGKL